LFFLVPTLFQMPSRTLKRLFLYIMRALGAFWLSRRLTRRKLRILCYHGFSLGDEYLYMPQMFMRAETFRRRMAMLERLRIPVISLDDAVDRLKANQIENAELVITLDDGWASNLTIAHPILKAHNFPATIYVTTEHLANSAEVFNVTLNYLFLACTRPTIDLIDVHPCLDGTYTVKPDPGHAIRSIIRAAEQNLTLGDRQALLGKIATAFGFDIDAVLKGDRFRLLTTEEIHYLDRSGVAIELHTHTHHLPADSLESMHAEIVRNREAIKAITGKHARHFCYPSGQYVDSQVKWLSSVDIKSATTCDLGLSDSTTNCLLLRRYLDQDDISDIEFEASVVGFRYFLQLFARFRMAFAQTSG
jgi:peptidoglycan/xylan/chitin deacetylase (PgdA/CDA1 family)